MLPKERGIYNGFEIEKRDYLARIKDRYRHAGRKHKKIILDEFCAVCGHHRKHAIRLLNQDGRRKRKKPGRPGRFRAEDIQVLEGIWLNADRQSSLVFSP